MLWKMKKCLVPLVVLMLSSSVFCLEIVPQDTSGQAGRLIIGSRRTLNGGINQKPSEHAGDTKGYQSDQPYFTGSGLAKSLLKHWNPLVWCNKDSMSLHMQGSQVPNFLVETDEGGPVPLSKMPSHCGYSVKKAHRDVSLVAKYDGCNIAQQGSTYILPLSILGVAVRMVCPVPRPVATVSCNPSAMVANLGLSPDAVRLKVNGEWQSIYQASTCGFTWDVVEGGLTLTVPYTSHCWQFQDSQMHLSVQYMDGELPLSCPAIQYTAPGLAYVAQQAINPWLPGTYHPYGHVNPWYLPYGPHVSDPVTTTAPTTTAAPARHQQAPNPWLAGTYHPYGYVNPWYRLYGQQHVSYPVATTAAPARQQVLNPWLAGTYHPYGYGKPWYLPYGPRSATHRPFASLPTTTTRSPSSGQLGVYPGIAKLYKPYVPVGVQVAQFPGVNVFQRNLTLQQKLHPSKPVWSPGSLAPLLIKGLGK